MKPKISASSNIRPRQQQEWKGGSKLSSHNFRYGDNTIDTDRGLKNNIDITRSKDNEYVVYGVDGVDEKHSLKHTPKGKENRRELHNLLDKKLQHLISKDEHLKITKRTALVSTGILTFDKTGLEEQDVSQADIEKAFGKWKDVVIENIEKEFGDALLSTQLHMDETNPHIHFQFANILKSDMTFEYDKGKYNRVKKQIDNLNAKYERGDIDKEKFDRAMEAREAKLAEEKIKMDTGIGRKLLEGQFSKDRVNRKFLKKWNKLNRDTLTKAIPSLNWDRLDAEELRQKRMDTLGTTRDIRDVKQFAKRAEMIKTINKLKVLKEKRIDLQIQYHNGLKTNGDSMTLEEFNDYKEEYQTEAVQLDEDIAHNEGALTKQEKKLGINKTQDKTIGRGR